jgi:hypothetical protein
LVEPPVDISSVQASVARRINSTFSCDIARSVSRAEALTRVKRDYTCGAIAADEWHELRPELIEEHEGAQAEVQRLRDQEQEVEGWGELEDAEAETLRLLSGVRRAIAGEVRDAEGIDAVRAALSRLFERFVLHEGIPSRAHVELIREGFWIEPIVREQAVEGYTENLTPVLGREPLGQAGEKFKAPFSAVEVAV